MQSTGQPCIFKPDSAIEQLSKNEFNSGLQPSEQGLDADTPPLRDGAEIIRAFSPCMPCGR